MDSNNTYYVYSRKHWSHVVYADSYTHIVRTRVDVSGFYSDSTIKYYFWLFHVANGPPKKKNCNQIEKRRENVITRSIYVCVSVVCAVCKCRYRFRANRNHLIRIKKKKNTTKLKWVLQVCSRQTVDSFKNPFERRQKCDVIPSRRHLIDFHCIAFKFLKIRMKHSGGKWWEVWKKKKKRFAECEFLDDVSAQAHCYPSTKCDRFYCCGKFKGI